MKPTADNVKLVKDFGARSIASVKDLPKFQTFESGLMYSHRDFDKFMNAIKAKKKCAILSGANASGPLHIGHLGVFLTNLHFQQKYNCDVYIPISDDESYIFGKVKDQKEGLKNSYEIARQILALGFNPKKTFFIIDQLATGIYNLAIKYSKRITASTAKAVCGHTDEDNIGIMFYLAVQAAHINLPLELGYDAVLVPIGPDEDARLRIARDVAAKYNFSKPATVHSVFMPGLDGEKMSSSKPHTSIFLNDSLSVVKKKINRAVSGGQKGIEEHRKKGGNPDIDIAYLYLDALFLGRKESAKIAKNYRAGKILSGEMKGMLFDKVSALLIAMQRRYSKLINKDVDKCLVKL
jgi:tryptophanyl-tRNA synthetase